MLKKTILITLTLLSFSFSAFCNENPKKEVKSLIKFAKKFQGVPYLYGGTTPKAFDCSGFVRYVYNNFGYKLHQPSYGLATVGFQLPVSDLTTGDLIFFRKTPSSTSKINHVGIVVKRKGDDIFFIHASRSRGIVISSLQTETYFLKRVEGGVRL